VFHDKQLYSVNRLVLLMGVDCVLCEVRTEFVLTKRGFPVSMRRLCRLVAGEDAGSSTSQSVWDLWCTKSVLARFFSESFGFSPVSIIPPAPRALRLNLLQSEGQLDEAWEP